MNTETRLVATHEQARKLATMLNEAADKVQEGEGLQHVRITLEQSKFTGPWGLIIHVDSEWENKDGV